MGLVFAAGFNYNTNNVHFCDGSLLNLSQNEALFSLLGQTYGGDGVSTFGIPDLRGRIPVGIGQATGVSGAPALVAGTNGGVSTQTIAVNNLPPHTHTTTVGVGSLQVSAFMQASATEGLNTAPGTNSFPAIISDGAGNDGLGYGPYDGATQIPVTVNSVGVQVTLGSSGYGSPASFSTMPPYTVGQYFIVTQGIYPQRQS